ncbi:DUF4174 domain-containing protein [Polaribacter aestuariivivens]|uniref:DUF4174 domain-containing protein n=1 Tax=Polaribacter aestuariivivens TaxID=2304626 RepID=A0A5S3N9V7_9FLAO|nr:DUF4174 domain-containing protein [Polaribacter aestuariivivens]TMM32060.1 DUF4174 domain-containing protein [Polaribacter aestuariivivens]
MRRITIIFLFISMVSLGQNMDKHQWKNRVLLVYTDNINSEDFKNQTLILEEHEKELLERKLLVYRFSKDIYNFNFEKNWKTSNSLYKKYVHNLKNFKVLLIGLDGGIKLTQNSVLKSDKLFTIIDGMPIRKRELKNKN